VSNENLEPQPEPTPTSTSAGDAAKATSEGFSAVEPESDAPDSASYSAVEEEISVLNAQIADLQTELASMKDQLARSMAEFQNFRRRNQEQAVQLRQFATENFVTALLPVLDNFERTVAHAQQGASAEQLVVGVAAVERQLKSILEGQNVRRIEAVGQPFDPEVHEAIAMEASEEHEANTVIIEVEAGYKMGDRLIRPSRVKVAQPT